MNNYTAMSLFSGMGGDSLGMQNAGCTIIAYNELKPIYCKTHDLNFPFSKCIYHKNIYDISKLDDIYFETYKNKIDILFAGFPCQGFSNAGKKKEDDPRNTMFREFLRVCNIIKPSMIIGENVKGLLKKKTKNGEYYIDIIISEFQSLNYDIEYKILNTAQYNVPQTRERLIIIGILKNNKYNWIPSFPEPCKIIPNVSNIISYDMTGAVRVDSNIFRDIPNECILENMEDETIYNDNNNGHPYLLRKLNTDRKTYNGITYESLFSFAKRKSPIHCEIIDIRKPSKTIICTYEHQPRLFVPLKNKNGYFLRALLADELKQIQGFPKEYKINGSLKDKIIQIGNAVPPPLIECVIKHIIE